MVSMDTWIISIKVFLLSAGAVFLAMGIKLTAPIAVNVFPIIWSTFLSCLKPPCLYIVINGIIITIAATSRFHQSRSDQTPEHLISVKTDPQPSFSAYSDPPEVIVRTVEEARDDESEGEEVVELKPVILVNGSEVDDFGIEEQGIVGDDNNNNYYEYSMEDGRSQAKDVFVDDDSMFPCSTMPQEIISTELQLDYLLPVREKPVVSSSSVRRTPIRASSGRVRSRRMPAAEVETLESTWKRITEGASRATPETPQEVQNVGRAQPSRNLVLAHVPKSKSFFKERRTSNLESLRSFRIQKEPSPSQDELNRRVEEFIKKFNEDMRLQRQRSLDQHYKEMINSGV